MNTKFYETPFLQLIGAKLQEYGNGVAVVEVQVTELLCNSKGTAHGGLMATVADAAMIEAVRSLYPEHTIVSTTNLNVSFLKAPIKNGTITVRAETAQTGKTVAFATCFICHSENGKVGMGTATFSIKLRAAT